MDNIEKIKNKEESESVNCNFFINFFILYYKFFMYDVKYSLLFGRNIDMIFLFWLTFHFLLNDKGDKEKKEKLKDLEEAVEKYALFFKNTFDEEINIRLSETISCDEIAKLLNECDELWDKFVKIYNIKTDLTGNTIHLNMLIEFNNFLSHFISYTQKKDEHNLPRAVSHLYRGILDGAKEIIVSNSLIILASNDLKTRLFEVREKERDNIGKKEKNLKKTILESYENLINDISSIIFST